MLACLYMDSFFAVGNVHTEQRVSCERQFRQNMGLNIREKRRGDICDFPQTPSALRDQYLTVDPSFLQDQ